MKGYRELTELDYLTLRMLCRAVLVILIILCISVGTYLMYQKKEIKQNGERFNQTQSKGVYYDE